MYQKREREGLGSQELICWIGAIDLQPKCSMSLSLLH